jgi:hypothetical protein
MTQQGSVLSEEELAVVNNRLKEIVRESGWSRTIAIGDLLVERVFQGMKDALGAPGDACKHPSIRKLAQRPDCPLRKTALAQAVGVYSLIQKEPALRELAGITPAHVAVVVSYPTDKRREMLLRAEAERWSVRTLSRATKEVAMSHVESRAGRRASSRQALVQYRASLKAAESGLRLLWRHEEMDREVAGEILTMIRSLAAVLNDSGELVTRMQRTRAPKLEATTASNTEPPRLVGARVLAKASASRPAARLPGAVNGAAAATAT